MQWRSAVQVKPQMYGVTWVIGDICLTFCQQHKTFLRVCKKKCHSCGINYFFVIVYENHATWVARYWNLWAFVCKDTKAPIWHIRGLLRQKTKAAHQSALGNSMPLRPEHSLPSASICVNYGCVLGGLMYHVCIHRKKKKRIISILHLGVRGRRSKKVWCKYLCCECHLSILCHQTSDTFQVFSWQMYLILILSDYARTLILRVEAEANFYLVSIHFCLKNTRWHDQIKLESKERCTFVMKHIGNTCWTWESHIAYYLWTHSSLTLNVGFSHNGYSLKATNKRVWRKEGGNTYRLCVDSMLWMNNSLGFASHD